jgi:hypothetical protein
MNKNQRESLARVIAFAGRSRGLWEDLDRLRPLLEPRRRRNSAICPRPDQTSIEEALQCPRFHPC